MKEQYPIACQIGMSKEDFWHEDEKELEYRHVGYINNINLASWSIGIRVKEAIISSFDNKVKYSETPQMINNSAPSKKESKQDQTNTMIGWQKWLNNK